MTSMRGDIYHPPSNKHVKVGRQPSPPTTLVSGFLRVFITLIVSSIGIITGRESQLTLIDFLCFVHKTLGHVMAKIAILNIFNFGQS